MSLKDSDLKTLKTNLHAQCGAVKAPSDLEMLRRDWLGKEGTLKLLFKELADLEAGERPAKAAELNQLREVLDNFLREKEGEFSRAEVEGKLSSEFIDLSLPGKFSGCGALHPITRLDRKVTEILRPFGVKLADGPEIETEYYCFDSLNIPKHHPARDMQDTFYTSTGELLRTHTTSVQARTLKEGGLPIRIISPGRVYRNETVDASHTAMFHQFELIWIDKGLTLSNLMGVLALVAKELYGKRTKIRFKPKYYPYTEPSIGLDVACALCKGAGCAGCGQAGWATVVGAGMVHRNVLKEFKYDPDEVSGIAFGFGTTRLAAQFFNLPRLKLIYENDLRLLKNI